jgi:hypothetical protein
MSRAAGGLLVAWTEIGEDVGVRVAHMEMEVLNAGW